MSGSEQFIPSTYGAIDLGQNVKPADPKGPGPAAAPADRGPAGQGIQGPLVTDVTEENFDQVVALSNKVPVILDLWATWCGPCKQLTPVLEALAVEFGGRFQLAKVDVDKNPTISGAFQVQSVPAVFAIIGGRPLSLFQGALPKAEVKAYLEELLGMAAKAGVNGYLMDEEGQVATPELPALHVAAMEANENGDYEQARKHWEKAILENPRDLEAKRGLAQTNLLARLEAGNESGALAAADEAVMSGQPHAAFAALLAAYSESNTAGAEIYKDRLVELFDLVGATDQSVRMARRQLAQLLY